MPGRCESCGADLDDNSEWLDEAVGEYSYKCPKCGFEDTVPLIFEDGIWKNREPREC